MSNITYQTPTNTQSLSSVEKTQQVIMDAVSTVTEKYIDSLEFDKTIECEIISAVDASTGEYQVKYLNGIFSAYDDTLNMRYRPGQFVYVQIPRNDMSLKKIIIGNKSIKATDLIDAQQDNEKVVLTGIPLNKIYDFVYNENPCDIQQEFGIYGSTSNFDLVFTPNNTEEKDLLFQKYAEDRKGIMISADFKTDWYNDKVINGNYGITLNFKTKDDKTLSYTLDRSSMTGTPLNYPSWNRNYVLLSIDGNNIKCLDSIHFFSENFKRPEEESVLLNRYNGGDAEIFIKNLQIQFAQVIDTTGYTVNISAVNGQYFDQTIDVLPLEAVIRYNGLESGISEQKAEYYWYIQDASVSLISENFDDRAGVCWRRLPGVNQQGNIYNLDKTTMQNLSQAKIKVIIYYEDYKISDVIDIYQTIYNVEYSLKLLRKPDGKTADIQLLQYNTSTKEYEENLKNGYTTEWLWVDNNGSYQEITNNIKDKILLEDIDLVNIYDYNTYYCSVFNSNGQLIQTTSIIVYNDISYHDFDIVFNIDNNGVYYYNEGGSLRYTTSTSQKINFIVVNKNLEDDFLYEYRWGYADDSKPRMFEFSTLDGNLGGSNYSADSSASFTILNRYNAAAAEDNIIKLTVLIEGIYYDFYKPLSFIKEGDPGTNGSSLVLDVRFKEGQPKMIRQGAQTTIPLDIRMYYNGNPNYNGNPVKSYFNIEASVPFDYKLNNPLYGQERYEFDNETLTVKPIADITAYKNAVIQIVARPKSTNLFPYSVSYLLPIPMTTSLDLSSEYYGPTRIQYDSQGYKPVYDATLPKINGVAYFKATLEDNDNGQSLIYNEDGLTPPPTFNPRENYFALDGYDENNNLCFIQPIVGIYNEYSNALANSWDGASLVVDKNNSTVFASQIGAGKKEDDNSFTGVLMGLYNYNGEGSADANGKTGLLGFYGGKNTFGFLEDGSSFIGAPGEGRIIFPATGNAIIQSQNYNSSSAGMKINLKNGLIDSYNFRLKSKALNINSENNTFDFDASQGGHFKIADKVNGVTKNLIYLNTDEDDSPQYIQSSNYSSTGTTTGMKINLRDGSISAPGFSIDKYGNAAFSGDITGATGTFYGKLYAATGSFSGSITAADGKIGDWYIDNYGIYNGESILYPNGAFSLGKGGSIFAVNSNGDVSMAGEISIGASRTVKRLENGGLIGISSAWGSIGQATAEDGGEGLKISTSTGKIIRMVSGGGITITTPRTVFFYTENYPLIIENGQAKGGINIETLANNMGGGNVTAVFG